MSLLHASLAVLGGLAALAVGGEVLVRNAVTMARRLNVSTAVIGLTLVAMATSLPELAVSLTAARQGSFEIAVGNVVGSNIFNLAVILGISAIFFPPLRFRGNLIRFDMFAMTAAVVVLVVFSRGDTPQLGSTHGIIFLILLTGFIVYRIRGARTGDVPEGEGAETEIEHELHGPRHRNLALSIVLILVGAATLTGGANLLVGGAMRIAEFAGLSERVIAITLVSVGTGLPELATAIVAGRHHHSAVAVGNVIGSNIFNVFGILGTVAVLHPPISISVNIATRDMWWMLAFCHLALLSVLRPSRSIPRLEGIIALGIYGVYITTLL